MVLGLLGVGYGFMTSHKSFEEVETMLSADSHGGGHAEESTSHGESHGESVDSQSDEHTKHVEHVQH